MTIRIALLTAVIALGLVAQETKPAAPEVSVETLVEQLGSDDFETRSRASEALRKRGEAARSSLEKALESDNLERKTRARNLLEEMDSKPRRLRPERSRSRGLRPDPPGLPGRPRLRNADEMIRRMRERMAEIERQLDRRGSRNPWVQLEPFKDLKERLELDLGPRIRQQLELFPGGLAQGRQKVTMTRDGERLSLEKGPDGVRFSVTPEDSQQTRTYEADSLEALKKEHPEIYERYEASGIFDTSKSVVIDGLRGFDLPGWPMKRLTPEGGPRLGVIVGEVPALLREHVDVPDQALVIERVQKGSPAERLGLRRHDVITRVDGQAVGTRRELGRVLKEGRDRQDEIKIDLIRQGRAELITGPRPAGK